MTEGLPDFYTNEDFSQSRAQCIYSPHPIHPSEAAACARSGQSKPGPHVQARSGGTRKG